MNKDELKDTYSVLSKASYDYYHHNLDTAQKELQSYGSEYKIDPKLSNKNAVVLKKDNDVVISYRGTDLKNPSDLLADTEIFLGRDKIKIFLNDRFDDADKLYNRVKETYPTSEITLTGHSLGSAQAIYVGTKNNTRSVSFNEGTSPLDVVFSQVFSQFGSAEANKKQTVYITAKDIISNLSILEPYDIRYVTAKNDLNFISHDLNYFLPKKEKYETSETLDYLKPRYKPSYKPKKYIDRYYDDAKARMTSDRYNDTNYGIDYFKELAKRYTR
jgi:hypothetical protein